MKHLPNALTLANLFCGCCALLHIFYWQPETAAWFTAGCFLFDYLDGMVARALRVNSPLGKELDSLADVVSFGAVPGAMLYQLIAGAPSLGVVFGESLVDKAALPAFVLTAFAAFRLAKFNLDTRQANYFIGLSTPACTVFVLGLALAAHNDRFGWAEILQNRYLLYALTGVLSWLMVSEIPMFGMKIKSANLRQNAPLIGMLALFALLLLVGRELALSAIIVCYIGLSILMKKQVTG